MSIIRESTTLIQTKLKTGSIQKIFRKIFRDVYSMCPSSSNTKEFNQVLTTMEKINTDIYVDQEKNIKYLDLCIDKKTLENLPYGPRNLLTFLASPYTDDDLINLGVIKVKDHNSAPHIDAPQEDQFIDLATLMNFDKFED